MTAQGVSGRGASPARRCSMTSLCSRAWCTWISIRCVPDSSPRPETALHTSVRRRARAPHSPLHPLLPLASSIRSQLLPVTTGHYLALVDWTGRTLHLGKKGAIPTDAPPILARLRLRPRQWLIQVPATESHYWRAIGCTEALLTRAHITGLKWMRGIGMARAVARAGSVT